MIASILAVAIAAAAVEVPYGPDPAQRLDVHPCPGQARAPVVVLVHGGGWTRGDKTTMASAARRYCDEAGAVSVAVNYRLVTTPQNAFPVPVRDAALALAWVQTYAPWFGGDPNRVTLVGVSAGAHIASLLAYAPGGEWLAGSGLSPVPLRPVQAFVGMLGVYDFAGVPQRQPKLRRVLGDHYGPGRWEIASPLSYVSAGAPPALLVAGSEDCRVNRSVLGQCDGPSSQSARMAAGLRRSGVQARLVVVDGCGHDLFCLFQRRRDLDDLVLSYIRM